MKKEILPFCEEKEKLKGEKAIEAEMTLPDYCGDIKRILKCTLSPWVHSVSVSGEKISVRGTAVARVIYADEKERIDCCEKSIDFSVSLQSSKYDGKATVLAEAVTDYVNCRAVNRRKISLNGSVGVICRIISRGSAEIPCSAPEGVEVLRKKQTQQVTVCSGEKTFEMSETVALGKDAPSVEKILFSHAWIETESLKAVQDKLLIKGELCVKTVYIAEGNENRIENHMHRMPLSQIMDIEDIDETCDISARCRISQLTVTAKPDSSETGRLIDISARVSCYVTGEKPKEYEYISDCYCTAGKHTAEYAFREVPVPVYSQQRTLKLKKNVQLPPLEKLCHVWVSDCNSDVKAGEDKVYGKISLTAGFLYLDDKGLPAFCERELEFESNTEMKEKCTSPECTLRAEIRDVSAATDKEDTVDFTAEATVEMQVYDISTDRYVSDIKETAPENKKRPALTVCYCEGGEKIWDIAKKYSTTVALIKEENGIEGDTVAKKRMLLIPCV